MERLAPELHPSEPTLAIPARPSPSSLLVCLPPWMVGSLGAATHSLLSETPGVWEAVHARRCQFLSFLGSRPALSDVITTSHLCY